MKIGITGTRDGWTKEQKDVFAKLATKLLTADTDNEFHHGDCRGVDVQAAEYVYNNFPNCKIICHPPVDPNNRGYFKVMHEIREPKTYFARNRDIVDETKILIGIPFAKPLPEKGGTSYTILYAANKDKNLIILWPDGTYALSYFTAVPDEDFLKIF